MDIEFHYYMTYLTAARAGFKPEDASIIAHSSQYVDDNDIKFEVDRGESTAYRNYISQTMNILKPKAKLFRIYPIFHFIPGDPHAESTYRKDGKMSWLNTTPNSDNANLIFDKALFHNEEDLYRIGIACHGYVDTWAHQNFTGYFDDFNAMSGGLSTITPNIGHADAQHNPDWPAIVWRDRRLLGEHIDNRVRFLDAAEHMLRKLMQYRGVPEAKHQAEVSNLRSDLDNAIGDTDPKNEHVQERIARYRELAEKAPYGDQEIRVYDADLWFDEAVNEQVRGLRDRDDFLLIRWNPLTDRYTWKDRSSYKESHWYRFQEAVKKHQNDTWDILKQTNMDRLDLAEL